MFRVGLRIKNFQNIIAIAMIIAWIFSGGPRIWNFPPEIQEARAAAPAFVSFSAIAASTGADVTVTLPTYAANDIMLLEVIVRDVNDTITWPSGWTQIATVDRGTTARYWWAWKRASASETDPLVNKSTATGDTYAAVIVYSGAVTSGDPWEVKGTPQTGTTDPSVLTGITTLSDESLVVAAMAGEDNNNTSITTTGTNPASYTEHYVEASTGSDGVVTFSEAARTTAGATGNVSVNWNSAVPVGWGGILLALKPQQTTTLGTGTDASTVTVAPESGIRDDGSFTFQTSAGTDSITALTVILAASGTPYNGLSEVRITNDAGTATYFSAISNPSSNTLNFSGGTPIPAGTGSTQFKIRVTPKTHAAMPLPSGAEYNLSPYVSVFTSTNTQAGSDSNANTLTIDNLSPNNATSTSGSAGVAQVTLNWTTSNSSDFNRSVVLRWAASTPGSEVPAEGIEYGVDNAIGAATVACARNDAASTAVSGVDGAGTGGCGATPLASGQAYSYKVFQKDSRFNYDVGVTFTGSPFTPPNPVPTTTSISPTSKTVGDSGFTLTVNGTNFVSSSVVKFDGSNRTTSYVSSTQITATIPASDLTTAGTFSITVFNPTPGGGTSNAQTFTVNNPVPTTTSISPTSKTVGDSGFTLTVNGTLFISSSVVKFNGSNRTTSYVSSTQLTATIPASDLITAGTFSITVFNPTPGGGTSNAQTFTVSAAPNPVPTTTSISPTSKTVGDSGFTLTINGTNFVSSSVVKFDGSNRTTSYVSSTQITATIPASDLTTAGTFSITVFNPTPGGGTSNAQTFTVNNPVPTTTSISPTSKTVGDSGFTLTVNGTLFISSSVVKFNGSNRTTSYVSSTQLTATIPASDLITGGTFSITVFNSAPGGGTSNAQTFMVNNPVPTTTSIDPTGKTVGDSGFTLTVNGTNFVSTSVVRFNGSDRTTTYVGSTQLTATIPSSDMTSEGTFPITVFNPTPGGGESNSQTFTVSTVPNPVPTTTSISPTSKNAGDSGFTLTVNGTNFVAGSIVKFDGSNRTTSYVSSTQLTATIPASDLTTAGTFSITVFNPTPGGGTSNAQTFMVYNLVPTTTSISPTTKTVYDSGFTLTVNGTNFVSTSVVKFDGSNRTTSYVSSTQLTATIPASDMTAAGTFSITVFNPTPGGGTSDAQTLTVNNPVPTTTSIDPTGKTVGDPGFTLTVSGTLFISSSVVRFNGSDRTTTFVNSTTLTAAISASDIASEGTFPITVFNPTPGGGESNSQTFTASVTPPTPNPVPTLSSISPSSATQNDSGFTMTLTGTDFVSTSVARFNGVSRTTTYVSSTQLTATIPSSDLTTAGNFPITVFTPSPGGGESGSKTFTVTPAPTAPTVPLPPVGEAVRPTTIIFSGKAFPGGKMLMIDKDIRYEKTVSQDTITNDDGTFYTSFIGILQGPHSFSLLIKDKEGRASQTKFFNINTLVQDFVVKDLVIPPTVALAAYSVTRGTAAVIKGYATPKSGVVAEIDGIMKKEAEAGQDGAYKLTIDTGPLEFGSHQMRLKQTLAEGKGESDYSPLKNFIVSRVLLPKADFNDDGAVDIRDWSIFLFHWGSKDMEKRMKIDLNNDGKIDISDFSIFVRNIRKK